MSTSPKSTTILTVDGMTCQHCVAAVTSELCELDGVTQVEVDLATGLVRVESARPIDPTAMSAAVEKAGYEVTAQPEP